MYSNMQKKKKTVKHSAQKSCKSTIPVANFHLSETLFNISHLEIEQRFLL